MNLRAGPSKIGGAKQVSLRSSAEEDSHLRPTGRPSLGEGLGKSSNRGDADSTGDHNDLRRRARDLEGIAERTKRAKKTSRTHRCQNRGAAAENLVEDLHLPPRTSHAALRTSNAHRPGQERIPPLVPSEHEELAGAESRQAGGDGQAHREICRGGLSIGDDLNANFR